MGKHLIPNTQTGAYCGILDPELTPEGRQMTQAFMEAYRSVPWAVIYVSPMKRAIATAQPLCGGISPKAIALT